MTEFTPSKKTAQEFHNGIEYVSGDGGYTGDVVQAEDINNLIESALYTQEQADSAVSSANSVVSLATNQPDNSAANNVGTPSVSIVTTESGEKKFKFSNLKGEEGITPNISMNATVNNEVGVPSVTVTKSGTESNPKFNLEFNNIKGQKGDSIFYGFDVINGKLIVTSAVDDDTNIKIKDGHLVFDI